MPMQIILPGFGSTGASSHIVHGTPDLPLRRGLVIRAGGDDAFQIRESTVSDTGV